MRSFFLIGSRDVDVQDMYVNSSAAWLQTSRWNAIASAEISRIRRHYNSRSRRAWQTRVQRPVE